MENNRINEEIINFFVNGVGTCVVVIIGIMLNCVSIHIVLTKYERTNIFYQMLIRLFCVDICVLITWLNLSLSFAFNLNVGVILHMVPYFSNPLTHISITASTFMTVAIAHERYLAIRDPLKYSEDKKKPKVQNRRLHLYIFVVLVISVVFNIPYFMDLEVKYVDFPIYPNATKSNSTYLFDGNHHNVTISNITRNANQVTTSNRSNARLIPVLGYTTLGKHPYYLTYYRNFTRLIVSGIVPFVLLIFFNTSIYLAMKKNMLRRRRLSSNLPHLTQRLASIRQIASTAAVANPSIISGTNILANIKRKDEENLSMGFVVIVTAFLFCHSLKFVLNFYDGVFGLVGLTSAYRIASYFSNFLVILNSAINTVIYCIMNTKFRNHFMGAMKAMYPGVLRRCRRTPSLEDAEDVERTQIQTHMSLSQRQSLPPAPNGNNGLTTREGYF